MPGHTASRITASPRAAQVDLLAKLATEYSALSEAAKAADERKREIRNAIETQLTAMRVTESVAGGFKITKSEQTTRTIPVSLAQERLSPEVFEELVRVSTWTKIDVRPTHAAKAEAAGAAMSDVGRILQASSQARASKK